MANLCWVRRDLRLHDHAALASALKEGGTILVFVFDTHILNKLKNKADRRISFIWQSLREMETVLNKHGSSLQILYGKPEEEIPKLAKALKVEKVFCNRDYEPYAKIRDEKVGKKLKQLGIEFKLFKDLVVFEKDEILSNSGDHYKIFTPYKNKWLFHFEQNGRFIPDFKCNLSQLHHFKNPKNILDYDWLAKIGFIQSLPLLAGGTKPGRKRLTEFSKKISDYEKERNYPAHDGTSNLSVYLRFGCLSIRDLLRESQKNRSAGAKAWLNELIWRDFYQMVLDVWPHVTKGAFKKEYDQIKWLGNPSHFKAWCKGETGFPIVDAAMRCLNETGLMHNRLRMIVASFLCKTLLIDWRKGEKYFAEKLLDFDLAANNGGWQWAAGTGSDAQPYFRIFNPYAQREKFDPKEIFIKKWVKEYETDEYPSPIVNYETNRRSCLSMYAVVRKQTTPRVKKRPI